MIVTLGDTKDSIMVTDLRPQPDGSLTLFDAADLLQGLIGALNEAGVARTAWKVPEEKMKAATDRVIHLRKAHLEKPWNDRYAAQDIVMRVLEACL